MLSNVSHVHYYARASLMNSEIYFAKCDPSLIRKDFVPQRFASVPECCLVQYIVYMLEVMCNAVQVLT